MGVIGGIWSSIVADYRRYKAVQARAVRMSQAPAIAAPQNVQPSVTILSTQETTMKFADWFRGVVNVGLAEVVKVITDTKAVVNSVPFLPANIKTDTLNILTDVQSDLTGLEALAGTLIGATIADGVDDMTTLLMNTANAIASAKSPAAFSAAEKTALDATWTAMKAQGDTLLSQFMAGIDPVKIAAIVEVDTPSEPAA